MPRRRTQTIQRAPRAASVIVADLNFGKYAPKPRNIDREQSSARLLALCRLYCLSALQVLALLSTR